MSSGETLKQNNNQSRTYNKSVYAALLSANARGNQRQIRTMLEQNQPIYFSSTDRDESCKPSKNAINSIAGTAKAALESKNRTATLGSIINENNLPQASMDSSSFGIR